MGHAGFINDIDSDTCIDIENTKVILADFIGKEVFYGVNKIVIDSFEEKNGHFTIWVNNYSKKYGKKLSDAMYFANNLSSVVYNEKVEQKKLIESPQPHVRRINTSEIIIENKESYKKEFQLARNTTNIHAIPKYLQREIDPDFKQERFDIITTVNNIAKSRVNWNDTVIRIESCFYFRDVNNYPSFGFKLVNSKTLHFPIKAAIRFLNSLTPMGGSSIKKIKVPENKTVDVRDYIINLPTSKINKIMDTNNTSMQKIENTLSENKSLETTKTLKDILLENIKNVQGNPDYIPQAQEVSRQVGQVINVLRTEMECIRLAQSLSDEQK